MAIDVRYNFTGVLIETTSQALLGTHTLLGVRIVDNDPSDSPLWQALPIALRPATITYYLNGADVFIGNGTFNDIVFLGMGDDIILSGAGDDTARGGGGDDYIDGGAGNDKRLGGDAGDDEIRGGLGNDKIRGDQGHDELWGDDGNDDIGGDTGDDYLFGGAGDDRIGGGFGIDEIQGGAGADILGGGAGEDAFIFAALTDSTVAIAGRDTIMDFQDGLDQIWLDDIGGLSVFRGTGAFTAAGQVRVVQQGLDVLVQVNTVGTSGSEMDILVKNQTTAAFSIADFAF